MHHRFVFASIIAASMSACSLWLALEDPYGPYLRDGGPDVVSAGDASDAQNPMDAGPDACTVTATSLQTDASQCLVQLSLSEGAIATTANGKDIFVLGQSGTVYSCTASCDAGLSTLASASVSNVEPALAATDSGAFWAQKGPPGNIYMATQGDASIVATPIYSARTLAVVGSDIYWEDYTGGLGGTNGVRHCTLGGDCATGNPAGSIVSTSTNAQAMAAVAGPDAVVWTDGTQVELGASQISSLPANQVSAPIGGLSVFWDSANGNSAYSCDVSTSACTNNKTYDVGSLGHLTQLFVRAATDMTWIDDHSVLGLCTGFSTSGANLACMKPVTYQIAGVTLPEVTNQLAVIPASIVFLDTSHRAWLLPRPP